MILKDKILVTGGAGFLGSHLCAELLKLGNYVICLDNLFTGSLHNIKELIGKKNFEFIEHDIINPYYREDISEIYNLACPASPIHYQENPIKTIKTCTIGSINMLGLAKRNNAKILQASTSEVYGDPVVHPQNESYNGNVNPIGIRSCYDEGKRCSESLFMDYHREHNLKIKIARIFNTYGPNMAINDGRVVSNFIIQALKNNYITINGDGKQTRSFLYVRDLINALIKLMQTEDSFVGPINLGNPSEIKIDDLAKRVIQLVDSNSKIKYTKLPDDDPKMRKPDINLAINKLKWDPKIMLDEGLINTIEYFKEIING
tara:strand:- start:11074 stop:12024 length:951 start_codon:yes stop_codon:yes gene_type:complete